jgi:2-keto-4-pentenoate hydratase/2-oxohepta-3-ene-1,7-dioic acid hydratase in catechol pathway
MNSILFNQRKLTPGKIVCVGRNYSEHIAELGNEVPDAMVLFAKPNSAIREVLILPAGEDIHYEGELSFLVEQGAFVAVGFGLDLTKRRLQSELKKAGLPWERAKAFDGSALFSAFVPLPPNLELLELQLEINGSRVQQGGVSQMIHHPHAILKEIQSFMTLYDGDIVMTGTPKGVGPLHRGDLLQARIMQNGSPMVEHQWLVS